LAHFYKRDVKILQRNKIISPLDNAREHICTKKSCT